MTDYIHEDIETDNQVDAFVEKHLAEMRSRAFVANQLPSMSSAVVMKIIRKIADDIEAMDNA